MKVREVLFAACVTCVATLAVTATIGVAAPVPPYRTITIESPTPQVRGHFGDIMHTCGDVDHDGVKEVITTADSTTVNGVQGVGRVWVLDGRTGHVLLTLDDPEPQPLAGFGSGIACLGDVNGDGIPDIAVGAAFQIVGSNGNQGKIYVFSGKNGQLLYTVDDPRPEANAYFGALFISALNEHGASDFAATAPGETVNGVPNAGAAYEFSGKDGRVIRRIPNPQPETFKSTGEAFFSVGLSNPGDVSQDGFDDLVVGFAGTTVDGNVDQGRAYLFSGETGKLLRTFDDPVPQAYAYFGSMYSDPGTPGDVNSDGVPDVYVDADGQTAAGLADAGQAYIFSGRNGRLLRALKSPAPEDHGFFGFIFSSAGDLYRDGRPDLLVGQTGSAHVAGAYAYGGTWVFNPGTGRVLADFTKIAPDAGQGLGSPGDVNRDGSPDYFVSAPRTDIGSNPRQGRVFQLLSVPGPRPRLTARVIVRRVRDRTRLAVRGRLLVPSGVSPLACGGLLMIEVRQGLKTLAGRRAAVRGDCSYAARTTILTSRLGSPRRNRIIARFLGNYLVKPVRLTRRLA